MISKIFTFFLIPVILLLTIIFSDTLSQAYDIETDNNTVISFKKGVDLTVFYHEDGYEFILVRGSEHYNFKGVFLPRRIESAVEYEKKVTGWKDDYFFLRTECNGNASMCSIDQVFMIIDNKLIHLGYIFSGGEKIGPSYENGFFNDLYNKFEFNTLTSHATAPMFIIVFKGKDGRFLADLNRTWLKNRATYQENLSELPAAIKAQKQNLTDGSEIVYRVLFNAIVAKYCQRDDELAHMLKIAQTEFSPENLSDLQEYLSQVIPYEKPGETPDSLKKKYFKHLRLESERFKDIVNTEAH